MDIAVVRAGSARVGSRKTLQVIVLARAAVQAVETTLTPDTDGDQRGTTDPAHHHPAAHGR